MAHHHRAAWSCILCAQCLVRLVSPTTANSRIMCVTLYQGEGVLELFVAAQAPPTTTTLHRTLSKVRKPIMPMLPNWLGWLVGWKFDKIRQQEPYLCPGLKRESAAIYYSVQTGI